MRLAYSEGLGFFCERIDIRKISLESSAVEKIGNSEFQQKAPNYYNFDVIISISLSDEMTIKATTKAVIKYLEAIKKKHREFYLPVVMKQDQQVTVFAADYKRLVMAA